MAKVYQCLCGQCLFSGFLENLRCEKWVELERWKDMCVYAATMCEPPPEGEDTETLPIPLFPQIYLHTLHGLTGKQLLPTAKCQAPEFTSMVVEWYIDHYDTFRPKDEEGEEMAQCRFYITSAQHEQAVPMAANRLILPTLLIELLDKIGLPPIGNGVQPDPIHIQLHLFWLQTMEGCEVCGDKAPEECIPIIIATSVEKDQLNTMEGVAPNEARTTESTETCGTNTVCSYYYKALWTPTDTIG